MLTIRGKRGALNLSGNVVGEPTFWGISMIEAADFFRARLEEMVDHSHPLVVLSKRLP